MGRYCPCRDGTAAEDTLKKLIIHADDLGMLHSINRASFLALQRGWVTSASAMVPAPWFPEVAAFCREHPELDMGVHLTVNSELNAVRWRPAGWIDHASSLIDEDGYLHRTQEGAVRQVKVDELRLELLSQVGRARMAGLEPSHLDGHMNTFWIRPDLHALYHELGKLSGLPVACEHVVDRIVYLEAHHVADRRLETWAMAYQKLLEPLGDGRYILIVHLGTDDAEGRAALGTGDPWGSQWRANDLKLVSMPEFRKWLKGLGFELVSWRNLLT